MADKGARAGARILDALLSLVLAIVVWVAYGEGSRIWTNLFLGFTVVWLYEALLTRAFGATPGKRALGLRVVAVDGHGRLPLPAALRRGAVTATLTVLPPISWGLWALSTFGDALGRGFADRAAGTMVVPGGFAGAVTSTSLPGYADGVRPPRLHALGRVADHDVRVRARLRRLAESRLLAAAIGLLALSVSLPVATGWVVLGSSLAWVAIFVAHETWLVHRTGRTPGHALAGLVICDRRTGSPPRWGRSFARALVLGTTLYLPILWWLLLFSMLLMRFGSSGRGLHDLAGGTVVVSDPALDPETQRQRSMRMRLGLAG